MELHDVIERAIDFGNIRSHKNFFSFELKMILYIIPAAIIGTFTDIIVKKLKEHKILGYNTIYYILLQTFIITSTLYFFIVFLSAFTSEFQTTLAGSFFIVLYFGMQSNYIIMLKKTISEISSIII